MVERYRDGVVPAGPRTAVDASDATDVAAYHAAIDGGRGYLLHEGLQAVWRMVARGNEYVDRQAPWKQAKDPALATALDETLSTLIRQLARFAVLLHPYMPVKSASLWQQIGGPGEPGAQRFADLMDLDATGWRVKKGDSLFPKELRVES
jgi:methionyl-tRNA synthetase